MNDEHKQMLFKHGATLSLFTSQQQMATITDLCFGEEGQFFLDKVKEYGERINSMPKTYEQDGMGDQAVAYLHYFIGGCDWYITEKDKEAGAQLQAFGLARLNNDHPELGYINIDEIGKCGAELDLHFTPCTLAEVRKKLDGSDEQEQEDSNVLDMQRQEAGQPLDEGTLAEIAAAFSNDSKEVVE